MQSWIGWRATDAAVNNGKQVPAPVTRTLLAAGVIIAILIVGVGLLVG